jgi:hypothetical protein
MALQVDVFLSALLQLPPFYDCSFKVRLERLRNTILILFDLLSYIFVRACLHRVPGARITPNTVSLQRLLTDLQLGITVLKTRTMDSSVNFRAESALRPLGRIGVVSHESLCARAQEETERKHIRCIVLLFTRVFC